MAEDGTGDFVALMDQTSKTLIDLAHLAGRIYEALGEHSIPDEARVVLTKRLLELVLPSPQPFADLFKGFGLDG